MYVMTALPIDLPEGFTSLVAQGDHVISDQVIARKETPKDEVVNIIQVLNLTRSQAKKALKKNPGEPVNPGDIIAVKKNFFGKVTASIASQIFGIILRYERDTGNLVIRTNQDTSSLELISPVAGTVSLCNNKEIVVETKEALISKGIAFGSNGEGMLFVLKEAFDSSNSNTLYYLDRRVEGKIVLLSTLTREVIVKGDSIGVAGFLGTTISHDDSEYLQQREIPIPVLEIDKELITTLQEWENKKVMIVTKSKAIILRG
ncbi:MAG TPA: hypothetical protein VNW29_01375 [Candidatus Sulfotelmatobacter sp.]|jgi:hypothetical protein|nr:hypothetical protein [Candidatus Sulfotelmatobacter sp.]